MLDIDISDSRWHRLELVEVASRAVTATIDAVSLDAAPTAVSILACDDARIAALNAEFREKPKPTNVLSWPETDLSPDTDGDTPNRPVPDPDGTLSLGDIALAYDTCAGEAAEQGKTLDHHVTHLIVHGTLHLLGYDHVRDRDAALMESLEVEILGKLGIPDPY